MEKLSAKTQVSNQKYKSFINAKILLLVTVLQLCFALIVFIGFILDPLVGIIIVGAQIFIINSFFMYSYFSSKSKTRKFNKN